MTVTPVRQSELNCLQMTSVYYYNDDEQRSIFCTDNTSTWLLLTALHGVNAVCKNRHQSNICCAPKHTRQHSDQVSVI